jgi:hypothetical protein
VGLGTGIIFETEIFSKSKSSTQTPWGVFIGAELSRKHFSEHGGLFREITVQCEPAHRHVFNSKQLKLVCL